MDWKILIFYSSFQDNREKVHRAIRDGNLEGVKELIEHPNGHKYALAKNYYGM